MTLSFARPIRPRRRNFEFTRTALHAIASQRGLDARFLDVRKIAGEFHLQGGGAAVELEGIQFSRDALQQLHPLPQFRFGHFAARFVIGRFE